MTRQYTDPIITALLAAGVMFESGPEGAPGFPGIVFDEEGAPSQIQCPDGTRVDFPGGGGGGGIPIPASNDDLNVVIQGEPGGNVLITTVAPETGDVPYIDITAASALEESAQGGSVSFFGGSGAVDGGGGSVSFGGGSADEGNGAAGAGISLDGGESGANGAGGRLHLKVGAPSGSGSKGILRVSDTNGDPVTVATNGQTVTITNLGPGAAPVVVARWLPIRDGDTDYFMPLFAAQV